MKTNPTGKRGVWHLEEYTKKCVVICTHFFQSYNSYAKVSMTEDERKDELDNVNEEKLASPEFLKTAPTIPGDDITSCVITCGFSL